jgi:hypothetical protein
VNVDLFSWREVVLDGGIGGLEGAGQSLDTEL